MEAIDDLVRRLRATDDDGERAAIKAELEALCRGQAGSDARSHLERVARGEVLEIQWELEEVLEATTPKRPAPAPPPTKAPEPPPKAPDPNRPLTAADLDVVYEDPRGLVLHKTRVGERWFATQVDPRTGQPQTFELHPSEVQQVKAQLAGSPYWVVGAGR